MSNEERLAIRALVRGRVHGVGFRYSTLRVAERLGVDGWVANRPDGTVEVRAEASATAITEFVSFLQDGPPAARVSQVDVYEEQPAEPYSGFRITG